VNLADRFWNASPAQLKNGFVEAENGFVCLLCGETIEKGRVYAANGAFYEASRYIRLHLEENHPPVFERLLSLDKRFTGLTEHQSRLLRLFYQGLSDEEVKKASGVGSSATIRQHRFALKEKERQAKVFLALMELLKEKDRHDPAFLNFPPTSAMVDDRFNLTDKERETILKKYFPQGTSGSLTRLPAREKQRLAIVREIAQRFESGKNYTEPEVNQVLKAVYPDYSILRRYLVDYGFMERKTDGSRYRRKG